MALSAENTGTGSLPGDFEAYYSASIEPELQRVESFRRNSVRLLIVCGVVLLASLAVFGWGSRQAGSSAIVIASVVVAILAGVAAVFVFIRLRNSIKSALVAPTCRFLGYEYSRKAKGFPVNRFYDLRLLRKRSETKTTAEDLIRGTQNGLTFQMCEVEIKDTRQDDDDTHSSKEDTLYHGILFVCEFPRSFKGETRVLQSVDLSLLPKKTADGKPVESVQLEESRFSQSFHVYASDQVEARYLLTPMFMERLTALASHFNPVAQAVGDAPGVDQSALFQKLVAKTNPVAVAFVDNQMLLAIHSKDNRFEGGSIFKPLTDRARVEELLAELKVVPEILDTLVVVK